MSKVVFRDKSNLKKNKSEDKLDSADKIVEITNNIKNTESENTNVIEAEHKIASLNDLNIGDHIIISVDAKHYRHAILTNLSIEKSLIEIIYYYDNESECNLNDFITSTNNEKNDENVCSISGVKKHEIIVNLDRIALYKVDYDITQEKCLTIDETLEKANKLVGSAKYNVFANNDEHFAIFCKTGKAAKLFIINPNDLTAKKLMGKTVTQKIATNLAQEGAQVLLINTAKHIATKFPRSAVAAGLPVAAEAAGSAIGAGLESISVGYDIYNKHKELKEGKISDLRFKKYIARRVTRGTMSVAGGIAGGFFGQMVIPIPVVGAVVGSLVGGIVGAVAGQGEGILLGELVEVIDNKMKEKDKKMTGSTENLMTGQYTMLEEEDEIKEQENAITTDDKSKNDNIKDNKPKETYHVIHKLVLKFDKDLLKPENWAHLKVEDKISDNNQKTKSIDKNDILINAKEKINDEDYEIYILNDSNEIVKNLNLESCFDSNGAISKRNSLEAFSAYQLPENINVFFKVLDTVPEND